MTGLSGVVGRDRDMAAQLVQQRVASLQGSFASGDIMSKAGRAELLDPGEQLRAA